jgi:hypothetical protein
VQCSKKFPLTLDVAVAVAEIRVYFRRPDHNQSQRSKILIPLFSFDSFCGVKISTVMLAWEIRFLAF